MSPMDEPVAITAPSLDARNVLHHDGDLIRVASEAGYTLQAAGRGDIELRTLAAGRSPFGRTSTQDQSAPFEGTLVFVPPS